MYEAVTSWSDEVAQTQEMGALVPRDIKAIKSAWTIGEKDGHPRFSSSEIVAQFVSMSQSLDNIVIVQHEDKLASIRWFRGGEFDGPPSTVCSLAPMGRCLPLVPISKPKHVVESYEATNRSPV